MTKPITFCIASANNEKEYTKLVLRSLQDHTDIKRHEILVFIDSDNQNTYEALLEIKQKLPNLRICKNTTGFPIGSQRNVSVMFDAATNDIVCYLQSDMVVGKDFDKHISDNINENTVLACARIEPPLHPPSPEKIVMDFGLIPEEFKYEEFNAYVDTLQKENRPNMVGHFAPFAIYKSAWFDKLGGFDTQFRCSREDSDTILRMDLCGLAMIQSWNACVYHFTCISSRGTDWFKQNPEADYKNELQHQADHQELKRFIRKWGFFGHHPKPVYDIAFNIDLDRYVDLNLLKFLEPFCKKMHLNDESVAHQLASQIEFEAHYYSNLRWKYSTEHWLNKQLLFNPTNFFEKIQANTKPNTDVVVSFKYSEFVKGFNEEMKKVIENIHSIVADTEVGSFAFGPLVIEIKQKQDLSQDYKRVSTIDTLLKIDTFKFE